MVTKHEPNIRIRKFAANILLGLPSETLSIIMTVKITAMNKGPNKSQSLSSLTLSAFEKGNSTYFNLIAKE